MAGQPCGVNSTPTTAQPDGAIERDPGAHRPARYRIPLTVTAEVPRLARRTVRAYLVLWQLRDLVDAAELAVTELIGNVVKHVPDRRCVLSVEWRPGGVRVAVSDRSPVLPAPPRAAGPYEESGRGLALVALITDAWGVLPDADGGGKTVWFELGTDGVAT